MKAVARTNAAVALSTRVSTRSKATLSRNAFSGTLLLPNHVVPRRPAVVRTTTSVRTMALFGGAKAAPSSLYDINVKTIDGKDASMSAYKGKVLLVVNLASQCGFTPQYTELAQLYDKYQKQGLEIIGQPCNQFGGQEPGSNSEVKSFAQRKGASFPLLSKADVNGPNEEPLWTYLKSKKGGLVRKAAVHSIDMLEEGARCKFVG